MKNPGNAADHRFYVSAMLSIVIMFYLCVLAMILLFFFYKSQGTMDSIVDACSFIWVVSAAIVFWRNCIYSGRASAHDAVMRKYREESSKQRVLGNFIVGLLVIFPLPMLVILGALFVVLHAAT